MYQHCRSRSPTWVMWCTMLCEETSDPGMITYYFIFETVLLRVVGESVQIAKDMERLAMIKSKREEERQDRIKKEGWDRFAPVTKDNHAPGVDPNAAAA